MAKLAIRVQPGASKDKLLGRWGDSWKLAVRAPPADGKANEAAGRLLAKLLGLRRADVKLVLGASSRSKMFETPLSVEDATTRLNGIETNIETST